MVRTIIAVLVTPVFAAGALTSFDLLRGVSEFASVFLIYLMYCYLFTLLPGLLILYLMIRFALTKIWHFAIAGFLLALIGISTIMEMIPLISVSLSVWASYALQFWELLFVGSVSGVFFSLVERGVPKKVMQSAAKGGG